MAKFDMRVPIPEAPGLISKKNVGGKTYVYYETGRDYLPEKKYTVPKRVGIGKLTDEGLLVPNENFAKFFPDLMPGAETRARTSFTLRAGVYFVLARLVETSGVSEILVDVFGKDAAGLVMDLAVYSIVTEGNAAQYYPDYTFNHPVFTVGMERCGDSKVSDFFRSITEEETALFLGGWNRLHKTSGRIYISYDSTNKNCQAGEIDIVEFGHAKDDCGKPVFNFSVAYDQNNSDPLFYEEYLGSVVDVSLLQHMLLKAAGYGYENVGFVFDRDYFSKKNIGFLDGSGFAYVIMARGLCACVVRVVESVRGTFEDRRACHVRGCGVNATTVKAKLYPDDLREKYIHVIFNPAKAATERARLEEHVEKMSRLLEKSEGKEVTFGESVRHYFELVYDREKKTFLYAKEKEDVVEREIGLCGYIALVTSEEMTAAEALRIYRGRDASEKLFRGDKSYLGNNSARVCSDEALSGKIFIEFVALILRNRIYTGLKNAQLRNEKKRNYMTVPAAIHELEKIEMSRRVDNVYVLDHAVTATQKEILAAFGLDADYVSEQAKMLSEQISRMERGEVTNGNG
jgi:transposase